MTIDHVVTTSSPKTMLSESANLRASTIDVVVPSPDRVPADAASLPSTSLLHLRRPAPILAAR